jgi:hypothetical protein
MFSVRLGLHKPVQDGISTLKARVDQAAVGLWDITDREWQEITVVAGGIGAEPAPQKSLTDWKPVDRGRLAETFCHCGRRNRSRPGDKGGFCFWPTGRWRLAASFCT